MRSPLDEERARAAEIVQIGIPVLCEAIAVIFTIGVAVLWVIIVATEIPA